MKNISMILSVFILSMKESSEKLDAKYPSEQWSATSWSFWLLQDFIHGYCVYSKLINKPKIMARLLFKYYYKHRLDKFSNHYDFTSKIHLFKVLNQRSDKSKILMPECGPAGLEIYMAKLAGYQNIVTFDNNGTYLKCFKAIWPNVEAHLSSSLNFNYSDYIQNNFQVLIPFWGHDNIDNLDVPANLKIACFKKNDLKHHLVELNYDDFELFYSRIDSLNFPVMKSE